MTPAEIESIKQSIDRARKALAQGLIADPDAASQLRRMIAYYLKKLEQEAR